MVTFYNFLQHGKSNWLLNVHEKIFFQLKDKYVTDKMENGFQIKSKWFQAEKSPTNLKNILNIYVHKRSFCYFYYDKTYLSHEYFH